MKDEQGLVDAIARVSPVSRSVQSSSTSKVALLETVTGAIQQHIRCWRHAGTLNGRLANAGLEDAWCVHDAPAAAQPVTPIVCPDFAVPYYKKTGKSERRKEENQIISDSN